MKLLALTVLLVTVCSLEGGPLVRRHTEESGLWGMFSDSFRVVTNYTKGIIENTSSGNLPHGAENFFETLTSLFRDTDTDMLNFFNRFMGSKPEPTAK